MNFSWLLRVVSGTQQGPLAGVMRLCLWGLTPFYRCGVWVRNRQFDSGSKPAESVAAKVISIGNITTGGTGKTPMVIWVCELLQQQGANAAIVSRGYGAKEAQPNDEAMELSFRLPQVPHVQNPDRVAAAKQCIADHQVDVIVLDDGFQHRRIARDLNIVLVDAANPFGYGYLIPRGLLREPISSLSRADAVVITRCEQDDGQVSSLKGQIQQQTSAPIALARTSPVALVQQSNSTLRVEVAQHDSESRATKDISKLKAGTWFAFSAIGNPVAFERSLKELGCELSGSMQFRDHHLFDANDHQKISAAAKQAGAEFLICTCKDLVKLIPERFDLPVFALQTELEIFEGQDAMQQMVRLATEPT